MHDPMTVAWTIKRPWPQRSSLLANGKTWRYWPTLVTVWHVSPIGEDACGWAFPRLTDRHDALVNELVREDLAFPYFSSMSVQRSGVILDPRYSFRQLPPGDAFGLIYAAWLVIAWRLERRSLTPQDLLAIGNLALCHNDNLRACLVDPTEKPAELLASFFHAVLRNYLRFRRPWYKHPRYHVHHWKITIEPLLQLKRWLWSRCAGCGKRFRYGESPTTGQWDNDGPRWFKGEPNVYHGGCYPAHVETDDQLQT